MLLGGTRNGQFFAPSDVRRQQQQQRCSFATAGLGSKEDGPNVLCINSTQLNSTQLNSAQLKGCSDSLFSIAIVVLCSHLPTETSNMN